VGVLPVGAQQVVVVAAGRDGVVLRHSDGRWERIGFPTSGSRDTGLGGPSTVPALTAPGQRIAGEYVYLALAVSIGLLLGGLAAAPALRRAWWVIALASVCFAFLVGQVAVLGAVLGVSSVPAVLVLVAVGLLFWICIVCSAGALTFTRAAALTVFVVLTFALGTRPFVAWSGGEIDSYDAAVRSATQLVGGSILAIILIGLIFRVRDHWPRPPVSEDIRSPV
jgi:hypothetical protein